MLARARCNYPPVECVKDFLSPRLAARRYAAWILLVVWAATGRRSVGDIANGHQRRLRPHRSLVYVGYVCVQYMARHERRHTRMQTSLTST